VTLAADAGPGGDAPKIPAAFALLPPSGGVPGWARAGEATHFPADDLWRQINGAADQFLAYGCQSLTIAYYSPAVQSAGDSAESEAEIAVEIYEMRDAVGAFGIYALERPPADPVLPIGAEGYQTAADINFFEDRYYVKLSAYPDGDAQRAAVRQMAEAIAATSTGSGGLPPELALFPEEGRVPGSLGLVPRAVLGLAELERAFVAEYTIPGAVEEQLALHLIVKNDGRTAENLLGRAGEALVKRATGPLEEISIGEAMGVRTEVKYRGPVLMLRHRQYLILAAGAVDHPLSRKIIAAFLAKLAV
jgi:hypothetical protein